MMVNPIRMAIAEALEQQVERLLREAGQARPAGMKVSVERPAHPEHGEYASNAAMQLARTLRRAPLAIAAELAAGLERDGRVGGLVRQVEVAAPGFLNMRLDWRVWADGAVAQQVQAPSLGDAIPQPHKAVIEHTSINPNKAAHIGHLRNSCIGDTLARLYKRVGYRVEVHNYIDDLGNQLADTVVGLLHTGAEGEYARFGDFCWDTYAAVNRAYKADPSLAEERIRVLHELEEGRSGTAWLGELVAEKIVREHVEEMKRFGIEYDVLVWESHLVRQGFWQAAFDMLSGTPVFRQETEGKLAGCWVLKQGSRGSRSEGAGEGEVAVLEAAEMEEQEQEHGLEQEHVLEQESETGHHVDKVLVRSNGILTYTAKDIAYHLWKFGLLKKTFTYKRFGDKLWSTAGVKAARKSFGQADLVLNVIDHRQEYPQAMVKQSIEALGFDRQAERLRHVSYGVVSLSPATAAELGIDTSDGKSSYAMSGRQGIGIKVADLLAHMERVIDEKRSRRSGLSSRAIAAAAIRYYLLRYNLNTEVVFDLHKAMEISGNTGVYLLYAYARAASLAAKAGAAGAAGVGAGVGGADAGAEASADGGGGAGAASTAGSSGGAVAGVEASVAGEDGAGTVNAGGRDTAEGQPLPLAALADEAALQPAERALLRQLAYWPDTLAAAAEELAPNLVAAYAHELATAFSTFYAACPILRAADAERRSFRLWLTARYRETLGDALQLLGLPTPSRM
ncbi:arginine--tRNA ligase domain-containing protein [Paenibacillus koleovorans]|nr:arginine--tRNA ligase [Paenibacillus koleovorans]